MNDHKHHHAHHAPGSRRFDPAKADKLDNPDRARELPPDVILARIGVDRAMRVADVGAGTGFFAIPFAKIAASVDAIDVEPQMIERLRKRVGESGLSNIRIHEGRAEKVPLASRSVDIVFMANLWHEIDDHDAAKSETVRVLRDGGRLAIVDWRTDVEQPPGPPIEHRISLIDLSSAFRDSGWSVDHAANVGMSSYLVVARPPGAEHGEP